MQILCYSTDWVVHEKMYKGLPILVSGMTTSPVLEISAPIECTKWSEPSCWWCVFNMIYHIYTRV